MAINAHVSVSRGAAASSCWYRAFASAFSTTSNFRPSAVSTGPTRSHDHRVAAASARAVELVELINRLARRLRQEAEVEQAGTFALVSVLVNPKAGPSLATLTAACRSTRWSHAKCFSPRPAPGAATPVNCAVTSSAFSGLLEVEVLRFEVGLSNFTTVARSPKKLVLAAKIWLPRPNLWRRQDVAAGRILGVALHHGPVDDR